MPSSGRFKGGSLGRGAGSELSVGRSYYTELQVAYGYHLALRASQADFGRPVDQSGKGRDAIASSTLWPAAFVDGSTLTVGALRTPAALNGYVYRVTAATGAAGAAPGTWPTVVGQTVTTGGVTFTCERGPWFVAASGRRHFCGAQNTSLVPGSTQSLDGVMQLPAVQWDIQNKQALIIRARLAWNGGTDSRTALNEAFVLGNRHAATNRRGWFLTGTHGNYKDLKFGVSDGTTLVVSGHVGDGLAGRPAFNRPPLDGNVREFLVIVDPFLRKAFAWGDGVAYSQSEMFSAGNLSPHNLDLSTITGSTDTTNNIYLGGAPGSSVSVDFGLIALDVIVTEPGVGVPVNMQAIADHFWQRGEAGLLLPESLWV